MKQPCRVLVIGAAGMLGHVVLRWFDEYADVEVIGSVRDLAAVQQLQGQLRRARFVSDIDVGSASSVQALLEQIRPDVVINCVGVVKQLAGAEDPVQAIPINALFPHRLARWCGALGARLVLISTDCVFSGKRGAYREDDVADAEDLYGRSKLMGEVVAPHVVTLRTSIIGHELSSAHALLGWFLSQQGTVPGFSNALFSALPTVELARVIGQYVLPNEALHGIYHVAGPTISKYELLKLVAKIYRSDTRVNAVPTLVVDRSLDGGRFQATTSYRSPDWPTLIEHMRAFG
jgi:dTDP-4-dehydrorhamnose reductase